MTKHEDRAGTFDGAWFKYQLDRSGQTIRGISRSWENWSLRKASLVFSGKQYLSIPDAVKVAKLFGTTVGEVAARAGLIAAEEARLFEGMELREGGPVQESAGFIDLDSVVHRTARKALYPVTGRRSEGLESFDLKGRPWAGAIVLVKTGKSVRPGEEAGPGRPYLVVSDNEKGLERAVNVFPLGRGKYRLEDWMGEILAEKTEILAARPVSAVKIPVS